MNPALYTKTFSRERSLLHNQQWYAGEASDPRLWTDKMQPFMPYIVFHRTGHAVDVYMDQQGIEWVKDEILKMMQNDPQFVRDNAAKYLTYVREKKEYIETTPALPLPELIRFADGMRATWPYQEIGWWGVEALEERPEYAFDLEYLLDIRKKTEPDTPASEKILLKSLANAFPAQARYAGVITYKEARNAALPDGAILEERLNGYFYTDNTLFPGSAGDEIEKKFNLRFERSSDYENVSSIRGRVAYPGIVRGRVRKIFNESDMGDFKEGEILVASSTIPPFFPVLQKAAGIVADEGGLISHTAIVARELKKPCVIGTKIATKVLKDGDEVEVDAEQGVVNVVKRA